VWQWRRFRAGPTEYQVTTSKGTVWADGLRYDPSTGGVVADAKFVDDPGQSMYEGTDNASPEVREMMWGKFDNEIKQYAAAINDPNNPITRLEIITSTPAAQANIKARIEHLQELNGVEFPFTVLCEP